MDELINNYIGLLKLAEDMDLTTLNDIKDIGNLRKKRTDRKLAFLRLLPKCEVVNKLKERTIQDNLDLQSRLAFWTFVKIQDTLGCKNLQLEKEPETEEEKLKLYDYFYHLVLHDEEEEIKNVLGIDNKLVFIDQNNNLICDNYKEYKYLPKCGNNSFLRLTNVIMDKLNISQNIDLNEKKLLNEEGPKIYTDVDQRYFMCDNEKLFNIIVLYEDGTHRNIKIDNYGSFKEVEAKSLKETKSREQNQLIRKKSDIL